MKNLSLLLNLVLVVAVAFLFYKVYSQPEQILSSSETKRTQPQDPMSDRIVFVNSDSLLDNYEYFNELKSQMESKRDSIDRLLQSKASSLEKEIMEYQQKAPGMTDAARMKTEEGLMKKQESAISLKDKLLDYLQNEETRMNDSIHSNLTNYLKELNKERNYLFILGYQRGSGILLANDSLDITQEVIVGINNR